MFAVARGCQLPAVSMSPHVLVRAGELEEQERLGILPASLFFCFFCLSVFAFASLLVTHVEKYKRGVVRFLLGPFRGIEEGEDDQSRRHLLNHQNLDQFNRFHQLHYHCHHYRHPFDMAGSKFAMDSNERVLFHVQVAMGCNGLRDLFNLGLMRQDTLEKRIGGATNRLSVPSIVSICAIWLREKICRTSSSGMSPSVRDLCVFLERRGCSRDMCCQIFYDAFQKCPRDQVNQVSLRVGDRTLTNFRDVVDHVFDNWHRWIDAAATAAAEAAEAAEASAVAQPTREESVAADDPLSQSYPAHNHDLASMPPAAYRQHFKASLKKLHKHQSHHYYQDKIKVVGGPPASHEGRHPGDCAPFDLGQASSWGSEAGQSGRCNTRLDDCVCRRCNIRGWLSLLPATPTAPPLDSVVVLSPSVSSSEELDLTADAAGHHVGDCPTNSNSLPGPGYVCVKCGAKEQHHATDCPVNGRHGPSVPLASEEGKQTPGVYAKMYMDPQRAAMLAETLQAGNSVAAAATAAAAVDNTDGQAAFQHDESPQGAAQPPQVPISRLEADDDSSSDLIMFSSSSSAEEVEPVQSNNDAGKLLGNGHTLESARYAEGRLSP
ncbi:hypothetical protein V8C37DRAFT_372358 [Trichoderma ceciliae]